MGLNRFSCLRLRSGKRPLERICTRFAPGPTKKRSLRVLRGPIPVDSRTVWGGVDLLARSPARPEPHRPCHAYGFPPVFPRLTISSVHGIKLYSEKVIRSQASKRFGTVRWIRVSGRAHDQKTRSQTETPLCQAPVRTAQERPRRAPEALRPLPAKL